MNMLMRLLMMRRVLVLMGSMFTFMGVSMVFRVTLVRMRMSMFMRMVMGV